MSSFSLSQLFCCHHALAETTLEQLLTKLSQNEAFVEGAVGKLDELAWRLVMHQDSQTPLIHNPWLILFAADHGIAQELVSSLTYSKSWQRFEAYQNSDSLCPDSLRIAREFQVKVETHNLGLQQSESSKNASSLCEHFLGPTRSFLDQSAMSEARMFEAIRFGAQCAQNAFEQGADLLIAADLGAGATTAATAMVSALSGRAPKDLVGEGAGLDFRQKRLKLELIEKALAFHGEQLSSPLTILQRLGGVEMAAMVGAYVRCAQLGLTMMVDGLVSCVAVWIGDLISRNDQLATCQNEEMLLKLGKYSIPETLFCTCGSCPRLVDWCVFAHGTTEPAQAVIFEALGVEPVMHLQIHQGEGLGALCALPLLKQACLLQSKWSDI